MDIDYYNLHLAAMLQAKSENKLFTYIIPNSPARDLLGFHAYGPEHYEFQWKRLP